MVYLLVPAYIFFSCKKLKTTFPLKQTLKLSNIESLQTRQAVGRHVNFTGVFMFMGNNKIVENSTSAPAGASRVATNFQETSSRDGGQTEKEKCSWELSGHRRQRPGWRFLILLILCQGCLRCILHICTLSLGSNSLASLLLNTYGRKVRK